MGNKFIVFHDSSKKTNNKIASGSLKNKKLFKTLSLLLSSRAQIKVLPTALLLDYNNKYIDELITLWGLPLMIRMDFQVLPSKKLLGGIPLYNIEIIESVSEFIFRENCMPLFHPHLDRFEDLYSCGVVLNNKDFKCTIEIVGKGFDASDLRLGSSNPHEIININLFDGTVNERFIIPKGEYNKSKLERTKKINKYLNYIEFVNNGGLLLSSLNKFKVTSKPANKNIPESYTAIPSYILKELANIIFKIRLDVLEPLPKSDVYIASFSYLPNRGWVLWDIYGSWYSR